MTRITPQPSCRTVSRRSHHQAAEHYSFHTGTGRPAQRVCRPAHGPAPLWRAGISWRQQSFCGLLGSSVRLWWHLLRLSRSVRNVGGNGTSDRQSDPPSCVRYPRCPQWPVGVGEQPCGWLRITNVSRWWVGAGSTFDGTDTVRRPAAVFGGFSIIAPSIPVVSVTTTDAVPALRPTSIQRVEWHSDHIRSGYRRSPAEWSLGRPWFDSTGHVQ